MNTDGQFSNERRALSELGDDRFDDSVRDQHQSELRSEVLQAFDQAIGEATLVEPHVSSRGESQQADVNLIRGYLAVLAVCLIGLVSLWFYHSNESVERSVVDRRRDPSVTIDPQLVASLVEVNAYRDKVSREALFDAIAMCQRSHPGRTLFDSIQP